MASIAAIILTYNEERHIERCIRSLEGVCQEIYVIDSLSKDNTREIAESLGAKVYTNPWKNYATQFNWGLDNCPIQSEWVWRIDADEYLTDSIGEAVNKAIDSGDASVTGIEIRRRIDFMGKPLLHGGWFPCYHLKVWKFGKGACENRWMDEHIKLTEGHVIQVHKGAQVDDNKNDLTWWTDKHNSYATREVIDMLTMEYNLQNESEVDPKFWGTPAERKRYLKIKYITMPLFVRPFISFFYRYFVKFGFLDGKEGFMWYVLQGFWYRFLVDAKIYEIKKRFTWDDTKIKEWIIKEYLS